VLRGCALGPGEFPDSWEAVQALPWWLAEPGPAVLVLMARNSLNMDGVAFEVVMTTAPVPSLLDAVSAEKNPAAPP
jgi:hypothetical protein